MPGLPPKNPRRPLPHGPSSSSSEFFRGLGRPWIRLSPSSTLQPVCLAGQVISQGMGYLGCLVFVQLVLRNQFGQESTVHAPCYIVPGRDGEKGTRIVIES